MTRQQATQASKHPRYRMVFEFDGEFHIHVTDAGNQNVSLFTSYSDFLHWADRN